MIFKKDDIDTRGRHQTQNYATYMTSSKKSVPAPPIPSAKFCFSSLRVLRYMTKWPIAKRILTAASAIETSHDFDCPLISWVFCVSCPCQCLT